MRLQRVRLFGFKTFADKTDIHLDGQIIAVVGPNGCGKSNLVDGVLWALGEHSAKALRAASGAEVIFAGSQARKPLGYAEVSLLFDNEDGALPIDTPEVAVSRKVNRAGETEYAINRKPCRLRDVVELLADSGLGRAGYAIVGQKDIDQALAASAVQRRAWIDEAAGVQRYRARREESRRRLDAAETHLTRLEDVLRELRHQREPLEEDARRARIYRDLVAQLREIESALLGRELGQVQAALADSEAQLVGAASAQTQEDELAARLERDLGEARARTAETDTELELARAHQTESRAALERALSGVALAGQRLEHHLSLRSGAEDQAQALAARHAQATEDATRAAEELRAEEEAFQALQSDLAGVGEEAERLRAALTAAEAALELARQADAAARRREVEHAQIEQRRRLLAEELEGIVRTSPELEAAVAEGLATQQEQEAALSEIDARLIALRTENDRHMEAGRALDERERANLTESASLEGRLRGVQATLDAHEGLAAGPRAVMLATQNGLLPDVYRPVGSSIEVEPHLAAAIDRALGGAAHDLIVDDDRDARAAIAFLKERKLGRATFQPVPLMRPVHVSGDLRDVLRMRGVLGRASELVQCEPRDRPVIESLLGRIVVVENLDVAAGLVRTSGWSKLVTLDGDVWHSSGAVSGGAPERTSGGMLQRRGEVHALEAELEALAKVRTQLTKQRTALQTEMAKLESERAKVAADRRALREEMDETRSWLKGLQDELAAAKRSQEKIERELAGLAPAPAEAADVDLAAAEVARDEALRALATRSADAESATLRLSEAESRLSQARRRAEEAARRQAHALEAIAGHGRRAASFEGEQQALEAALAEAEAAVQAAHQAVAEAEKRVEQAQEARSAAQARLSELAEQLDRARKRAQEFGTSAHQAELAKARHDARRGAVVQRLLEEYGLGGEEAIALAAEAEIPADAPGTAARLRREIKEMGEVNLGAIEAYDRLNERLVDWEAQVDDVNKSREEIKVAVRELDRLTRERFAATFAQLQVAFAETFQRAFGGGEAKLSLTEGAELLDAGVEIEVVVPGKKRQRLELLSGGERAMSALAFLFALLKVKPTPLAILDEVDAPLDGRNVERFIGMMREFCSETQFVLITHNPVTIASAEVWFGVTMQEPGVSTVVPMRAPYERKASGQAYVKG